MLPVRFAADPVGLAALLAATAAGVCLGTVSGLVPGLHANTLALLLAATAGSCDYAIPTAQLTRFRLRGSPVCRFWLTRLM